MPIDYNLDFVTSSTRSSALSLTSSTGLTINNQVIGGFHAYHSLNNIINGSADNKIPPIFTQGGTTSETRLLPGCNDSGRCLANLSAVGDGFATTKGEDITAFIEGELGLSPGGLCSSTQTDTDVIDIRNSYCQYTGTIDITSPSSLELNSDLVSSGRLQIGMVVYITEKFQSYQFIIDDYETLYNAAENSGDITTTTFTTGVGDGNAGGAALIEAWTVHKVEGELKDPANEDLGRWSRDEANWKKYPNQEEYFSINNVPASESIDDFNFEDAIIVVPDSWNNKKVTSVVTSISTHTTNIASTISLNHTPPTGPASKLDWTHATDSKTSSSTFSEPLLLQSGAILNLSQTPKFGSVNLGYSATFKVEG